MIVFKNYHLTYILVLLLLLLSLCPQKARSFQLPRSTPRGATQLFTVASNEPLPSAYDKSLPAFLRGEAVRSALKSDRGVLVDFTSPSCTLKNVGVVMVSGEGTPGFLNSKLSNSFPNKIKGEMDKYDINGFKILVEKGEMKQAGLLSSKGHVIDVLTTCSFATHCGLETYVITSPGHGGSQLFERMNPFIFPLDKVTISDICPFDTPSRSRVLTFIASENEVARRSLMDSILPVFKNWQLESIFSFPSRKNGCIRYTLPRNNGQSVELVVWEQTVLPTSVSKGYTVLISDKGDEEDLGLEVWDRITAEDNIYGPIAIGPLEYETLRIEGGQPAFGFEMTGHLKDNEKYNGRLITKASPLELHLDHIVDQNKGCYQGQEGVAALLKNKRGVPRVLYSAIFPDEDNSYIGDNQEEEALIDNDSIPNETKLPQVGDSFYVLGSNKQIKVGTLTSVAERGGTSMPETVALALVLRAQSILKKMKDMDLEIERDTMFDINDLESGIISPPPFDPLDGLQVVLENGMTRGYLRAIRSRKFQNKSEEESDVIQNEMLQYHSSADQEMEDAVKEKSSVGDKDVDKLNTETDGTDTKEQLMKEAERLAEAKRKAEKIEMLKKRAEEAMNRRQKRKD